MNLKKNKSNDRVNVISKKNWTMLKPVLSTKQASSVTHLEYASDGHCLAASAPGRVMLLDVNSLEWIGEIGQFLNISYSASFRHDGKVLVAGGENPVVQVFDTSTRTRLRKFFGHTLPVHCTRFSTDNTYILSSSDDTSIRIWDLAHGSLVSLLMGHSNCIRTADKSPVNNHTWLTGCYDQTVRLWDIRTNSCSLTMNHGAPVEKVLILSEGTLCVSSGGCSTCIWDLSGGGRLLQKLNNNHKPVTDVCFATGIHNNITPQLIIGSADGSVRFYDISHYKVSNYWKYHSSILCLNVSPNLSSIAAGMADGTFCIRKRTGIKKLSVI